MCTYCVISPSSTDSLSRYVAFACHYCGTLFSHIVFPAYINAVTFLILGSKSCSRSHERSNFCLSVLSYAVSFAGVVLSQMPLGLAAVSRPAHVFNMCRKLEKE